VSSQAIVPEPIPLFSSALGGSLTGVITVEIVGICVGLFSVGSALGVGSAVSIGSAVGLESTTGC
jgi:hypothetical protein